MNNEIKIQNINTDMFNIFDVTPEELLAYALQSVDLISNFTSINDMQASALYNSFHNKRKNFKEATRLGNLLVKHNIITSHQLEEALKYQKRRPEIQIGTILLNFNFCSASDIQHFLNLQIQTRENLKVIDQKKKMYDTP